MNTWKRILVTDYAGMYRFNDGTVYSFERWGNVLFAKKRHTKNWIQIDHVQ